MVIMMMVMINNNNNNNNNKSRKLSGIALGYELDDGGFESEQGLRIFSSPLSPDRLWDPPNLLLIEYQGLFPWG
jgi:hypothetical protein